MATAQATPLARIREFFGMDLKSMKAEWTQGSLTALDKKQLMEGVADFYERFSSPGERDKFLADSKSSAEGVLDYTPTDEQISAARAR